MLELTSPIRIYWDLTPLPAERRRAPLAICDEILAVKILSLNLLDTGASLSPECLAVLAALQGKPISVTLTAAPAALGTAVREQLQSLRIKSLLVSVCSLAELRSLTAAGWQWSGPPIPAPGISLEVDGTNWQELPELLIFCREQGITQLVLPIFRAGQGTEPSYPDAQERRKLSHELQRIEWPTGLTLTIHDPLLWAAVFPERPFPESGCQAANSMLYIAPDGTVHPCPLLPFGLGDLAETSLAEIIFSPGKRLVREHLSTSPGECHDCVDLSRCLGGCRGRGFIQLASWQTADPACR